MKKTIKNISFVFLANIIATIGSAILSVLIPSLLSVSDYGYWQLNVLYCGYIALFHFGWIDGIYVRYAGTKYQDLNKSKQHSQFWALCIIEIIISVIGIIVIHNTIHNAEKAFAIEMVFVSSAMSIPLGMLNFILQGCDRITEYSISTILSKLVYLSLSVLLLLCGAKDFKMVIMASIVGVFCSLVFSIYKCRDIVFAKGVAIKCTLKEASLNIRCGLKISVAYLTGNLIVGVIKYLIENEWGIEEFGRASLTISITHLLLVFINAVGVVLLPIIRNICEKSQKEVYKYLNYLLTVGICSCYVLYYPFSVFLNWVLPQYTESIAIMALIFPICLFEAKMGLLNNTYLKALRKENGLLTINSVVAIITILSAFIVVKVIGDFTFAVMLIMIMLALRCIIADIYIQKIMGINNMDILLVGIIFSALFVIINAFAHNIWFNMAFYIICLFAFFIFFRRKILQSICWVKAALKGENE